MAADPQTQNLLEGWVYLEADFLREYGLDLMKAVETMSWRRFLTLVRGLSSMSAYQGWLEAQRQKPLEGKAAGRAVRDWLR